MKTWEKIIVTAITLIMAWFYYLALNLINFTENNSDGFLVTGLLIGICLGVMWRGSSDERL